MKAAITLPTISSIKRFLLCAALTLACGFALQAVPTISSFSPTSGPAGTIVTLTGTNFTGASQVTFYWNVSTTNFTVNSPTQITVTVPSGVSTGKIGVTTPGGTTNSYTNFTPAPTFSGFAPTSGAVGTAVTLTGTNFTGATTVKLNFTLATFTVVSATQITTSVPSEATTGPIQVTTPGGTASSASIFPYNFTVNYPAPQISSFTPASGPGGSTVTLNGTNYTGATAVKFNGTTATYSVTSPTQILTTVPVGATTGLIEVTTPAGTASSATNFIVAPAPTLTSFSPTAGAIGTAVTLTGTNLTGATAVKFKGTTATFTVVSATQITTSVPTGTATGLIQIVTPGGLANSASAFTVGATAPSTTTQPANATVTVGVTATFNVAATGTAPLTYQWSKNGTSISGATSASYTTPATVIGDNASTFSVVVTNSAGSAISTNAVLTVNPAGTAPTITAQPANAAVNVGATATFNVTATGTAPLTYQWSKNGGSISGATSASYTTPATVIDDNGALFSVMVSNSISNAVSNAPTLTVNSAPAITTQPAVWSATVGATATFSVAASGTAPLTYQWRKTGTAIGGATSASYTTPATVIGDNGATFDVIVTNSLGNTGSNGALLTVTAAPTAPAITTQPTGQTVTVPATATFTVVASGTAPLSYQWLKNGAAISGATSVSYTTPATVIGDNAATFSVVAANSAGSATSTNAVLTVTAAPTAPTITTQPVSQTATVGAIATFSVTATGTAPLTYQWSKNGAAISGATSVSYTTPATVIGDNASTFTVVVTNSTGSATSNNATLTVTAAPTAPSITTQPIGQAVTVPAAAPFTVVASGTAPLTNQWQKNSGAISGATSASYTTPATVISDNAATFSVVVTNSAGGATSATAVLTVNPPAPITITLSPALVSMPVGGSQALTASLSGTSDMTVSWTWSGGTFSGTGLNVTWTAPQVAGTYTVTVQSQADTTKTATATVRVNPVICAP